MQNILLGTSQRSFTCENTAWIQPLAVCTKPQGESTLKWCEVHRWDKNPQTQIHRAVFRLAELASHLSWALSQGNHKGSTALPSCYERLPVLGEDAEVQIPNKKLRGKWKYYLFPKEGRGKVIDALVMHMWCIRRAFLFSIFTVKLSFVFLSYV